MKSTKSNEFLRQAAGMNVESLLARLKEKRVQLEKLRFDLYFQKLKNNHSIRATRVEIAQILTVLNRKLREKENENETT